MNIEGNDIFAHYVGDVQEGTEIMGVTLSSFKSDLFRARKKIRHAQDLEEGDYGKQKQGNGHDEFIKSE